MTTVTVSEAQHNLAALLRQVEAGEEVTIRRRNRTVARLVPVEPDAAVPVDWSHLTEFRRKLWGGKHAPGMPISQVVIEARGDR